MFLVDISTFHTIYLTWERAKDGDHWMASVELSGEGEDSDYDAGTKQVTEPLDFKCVANAGVSGSGSAEALATVTW